MVWILMHLANDIESTTVTDRLLKIGECNFDITKHGYRLQPIVFGYRRCNDVQSKFHYFRGEAAAGRWAIGHNCRFIWGGFFYWLCD